jgi:hypothetical protein
MLGGEESIRNPQMVRGDDAPALGKGNTMTKYGNLLKGVVAAFMMMGIVACSTVASPPVSQIAPNDHAALATWYEKEAVQLRQKAKDMEDMKARYLKYPALIPIEGKHGPKTDVQQHCSNLVSLYTKSAEAADELAQMHRDMVK